MDKPSFIQALARSIEDEDAKELEAKWTLGSDKALNKSVITAYKFSDKRGNWIIKTTTVERTTL